jgi:predicted metal-dependent phosphoesterase TrpH
MKVDLHIHSTASDGRFSPQELVRMAADSELRAIAITDHDSVEGIASALAAAENLPSLIVIPGVEISTDVPHSEVHILGYFIDYTDAGLAVILERLRNSRRVRAQRMVAKLDNLGIHVSWERVQELASGGSVGRPHIAQAMFEQGCVLSPKEAFLKYIGRNGPAYVEREKMTPSQAVELVVKIGGLPVLAHPASIDNLEEFILKLQKVGLIGIEAYYNGYVNKLVKYLVSLAHKYGLIACGGSDYHGLMDNAETPLGGVNVPYECVEQLLALARKRVTLTTR